MKPKIRLTRKEKRLIRKGAKMDVDKATINPHMSIPIAYALQHGYEVVRDDEEMLELVNMEVCWKREKHQFKEQAIIHRIDEEAKDE